MRETSVRFLFIGLGGFVGAILRYWVGGLAQRVTPHPTFPLGTLIVNVIGCFVIGILAAVVEARGALHPNARVFLTVGLIGGFTTFSAFANETFSAYRDGSQVTAIANVLLSVGLGLLAVWAGRAAVAAALR
jgi:CrcB protein